MLSLSLHNVVVGRVTKELSFLLFPRWSIQRIIVGF